MSVINGRTRTELWCVVAVIVVMAVVEVAGLNGDHVCMVQQKYNITKRVKYRAPMSVRTYEWCLSMPPRCSKWSTEMRDLTRLETEERTAEVAVCCPGYKMKDVSCVPVCPAGKTGSGCSEDCPKNKWGPNCVYECKSCSEYGYCSPITGECRCGEGRQGERCEMSMTTPSIVEDLTITKPVTMPTSSTDNISTAKTSTISSTRDPTTSTTSTTAFPSLNSNLTTSISTVPIKVVSTSTEKAVPISTTIISTKPTKSPTATSTISTTVLTTLMTAIPDSKVETILQTDKVATFSAKKIITTPYTTTLMSNSNNLTLTTPWILPTYKSKATTETSIITSTVGDKRMIPITTEAVRTTTAPTTTVTVLKTVPSTKPRPTTTKHAEVSTDAFKVGRDNLITDSTFKEATRKPETTVKIHPTTAKFKPKEIWIRPAQKGELLNETKVKPNFEQPKYKAATKAEVTTNTTPKTIIVSIIPTSISYASFKKIALTTSSYFLHKNVTGKSSTEAFTKSMSISTPLPVKKPSTKSAEKLYHKATTFRSPTPFVTETEPSNTTNSMSTNANKPNSSNLTTIPSTNSTQSTWIYNTPSTKLFAISTPKPTTMNPAKTTDRLSKKQIMPVNRNFATKADNVTDIPKTKTVIGRTNDTKITTPRPNTNVTEDPDGEETFHILTEPEHITAVMGEKGTERSSVDLISVISIAGGVMMTVITVAVVIVMVERCKRPRYEEGKMNNIRMQVMIDNNDGPPPYVRSIFNTPLPEPPSSEKCHYQPISTLDRNLKQFMRPVVVQTISPMMLENFRGILECHYDHLPRRSVEFHTLQSRRSLAPSLGGFDEPRQQRPDSLAESAIEALKCEAKLDVIDNTTSEPLYAEIPCWRPPSAHAVEVVNLNGEAVTEL